MHSANNVEYIGQSFSGRDYESGRSAVNLPVTLQTVLDAWNTSAGKPDFNVLFNGASSTLKDAIGSIAGIFVNVKAPAYGAVGDGVTDDSTAVEAALTAAGNAGGGLVFFPTGTYRLGTALNVPANVSLWGCGANASVLSLDHASANGLNYGSTASTAYQEIRGLSLQASQTNSGTLVNISGPRSVLVVASFIGSSNSTGTIVNVSGNAFKFLALGSQFTSAATSGSIVAGSAGPAPIWLSDSRFILTASGFTGTMVSAQYLYATACEFNGSAVTSSWTCINVIFTSGGQGGMGKIVGCTLTSGGLGIAMSVAGSGSSDVVRFSESGNNITGFSSPYFVPTGAVTSAQVQLETRDVLRQDVTDNSASVALGAHSYGTVVLTRTTTGAQTLTALYAPENARLTVLIFNNSGGTLGTISFGSGFVAGTGTVASLANQKVAICNFKMCVVAGGAAWVQTSAHVTGLG
jgi:hypothetical protein